MRSTYARPHRQGRAQAQEKGGTDEETIPQEADRTVRLCADDIMTRLKLKSYQDTYAEAMAKYGLQMA